MRGIEKDEIRRAAAAFAQALQGIEGKLPIERMARKEIELFRRLRDAGTPWIQIASMLSKAGVKRRNGMQISADQLRAMISRIERSLAALPVRATRAVVLDTDVDERPAPPHSREMMAKRSSPTLRDSTQSNDHAEARRTMARASAIRKT